MKGEDRQTEREKKEMEENFVFSDKCTEMASRDV